VVAVGVVALLAVLVLDPGKPTTAARASIATTTTASTATSTTAPPIVHDVWIPPVADGVAPLVRRIPTSEPVVFLTIDDGAYKDPFEVQMLKDNRVRASLFLAHGFIRDNPTFFSAFLPAGSLIENHSITHRPMPRLSYDEQVGEICGQADLLQQQYGRRPVLFRPPGGAFNANTLRAAATCGMRGVVHWFATVDNGAMHYQVGHALRPGDIVLMHFRPAFRADLEAFLAAAQAAGLHTELLEDWLPLDQ
jgi:peptidoglycan/xylan/chitin deacetylase (PgdA/CDA1 family)